MSTVQRYINRIRNADKKEYARRYALHMLHNAERPEPPKSLSYMAARGVRIWIDILAQPILDARVFGRSA